MRYDAGVAGKRTRVNVFLAVWLSVLVLDGFRPCTGVHRVLEDKLDHVLVVTGLWQGPWRLFGPEVDKINLRLAAQIHFADGATAAWQSPEWTDISGLEMFYRARRTNYFSNILKAGQEPSWEGLCAYLARTVPHPAGKPVAADGVVLILRGAIIPPPDPDHLLSSSPYLAFDEPSPIFTWKAPL